MFERPNYYDTLKKEGKYQPGDVFKSYIAIQIAKFQKELQMKYKAKMDSIEYKTLDELIDEGFVVFPTITISREYGCEGFPIAAKLAQKLNEITNVEWTVFDRNLLEDITNDKDLPKEIYQNVGMFPNTDTDRNTGIWEKSKHVEAFKDIERAIETIGKRGLAIIVGRGSSVILQHLPHCYHFRLYAASNFRVKTFAERYNKEIREARNFVKSEQDKRAEFINEYLKKDVTEQNHFHACFNNEKLSVDTIAVSIINTVVESCENFKYLMRD